MNGTIHPPRSLLSAAGRAIGDYAMIEAGDRVLLGLSGGKDSLSLLHVLLQLQKKAPVKFELAACTVDPQSDQFDPSPLKPYMAGLGVKYFFESQPIVAEAQKTLTRDTDSFCAYCSRMRRGILYRVARENGYNVLALAQHLDDLAETHMLSMFFGGNCAPCRPITASTPATCASFAPSSMCANGAWPPASAFSPRSYLDRE